MKLKRITRTIKNVARDTGNVLKYANPVTGVPLIAHDISRSFTKKRRQNQAAEGEAERSLAEQQGQLDKMAGQAMDKYKTGKLDSGAQAAIDKKNDIRQAQLRERLGSMGIGTSSTALESKRMSEQMKVQDLDQARDAEYTKTMAALGLSTAAIDAISKIHADDRLATANAFASTMEALGNITSMATSRSTS